MYFDDAFITRLRASQVVEGAGDHTDLAFGLYMLADKTADIVFRNIRVSTDENEVASYISEHK